MIYNREAAAGDAAMETAKKMVAAAVTAPKGAVMTISKPWFWTEMK